MRSSFVQLVALVCGFWTLTNGSPVSTPQGDEGKGPSKSDGPLQKDIVVLSPKVIPALNKEICWKPVVFESDKKVGTGSNKAPTADKNKGQSINKKNPKALPRGHRTGNRDRVQPDPPHGRVYSGEWLSEAFFQPDQGHPFTFIDYNEQPYIAASHVGQESQDLLRDQYPSLVTSREYIQPGGNNRLNREQSGFTNHPTRHRLQHELQISPPSGMSQEDFERRAEIEEWPPASAPQGGRGALLSYVPSEDQGNQSVQLNDLRRHGRDQEAVTVIENQPTEGEEARLYGERIEYYAQEGSFRYDGTGDNPPPRPQRYQRYQRRRPRGDHDSDDEHDRSKRSGLKENCVWL
ncbi:hypothetical protein MMC09_005975 [Bachmanniomyces sp. S44760]|nr:hypothetical protein [Bachmanniomyces sp. S44760]